MKHIEPSSGVAASDERDGMGPGSVTIESIESYALAVPLKKPPADSHAALTHWTVPVVEIRTSDGLLGTGISGVHAGEDLLCAVIDDYYAPQLLGQDPRNIRQLWHQLYWSPLQWIGRLGITHMALSMVDTALWDLAAKRSNQPLWRHLGGRHRSLRTYNTDGGWLNRTEAELQEDLRSCVAAGWDTVKIKVGKPDWREDVRRIKAAREAVGESVTLACDANKMWDFTTAMRILPALEEVDMAWIEEPFHPDDVAAHARLQAATRTPVAAGESLYSIHSFSAYIAADALRIAQLDVTRVGGVTEYLEVASLAAANGIPVVPHAGDMMVLHQHLAASSLGGGDLIEYLPWTLEVFRDPVQVRNGRVELPEIAGASTDVSADARSRWAKSGVGTVSGR